MCVMCDVFHVADATTTVFCAAVHFHIVHTNEHISTNKMFARSRRLVPAEGRIGRKALSVAGTKLQNVK